MVIFKQFDFSGGLNTQADFAKTANGSFPLLINGRARKKVISPTSKHVKLDVPTGTLQGLYIAGSFMLLFVSGVAYYANAEDSPIVFVPVDNWSIMDTTVDRIFVELVPASSNQFNKEGTPDDVARVFNGTIQAFPEALFCFDGKGHRNVVFPTGTSVALGDYENWTKDVPNYVPDGVLPAFGSNKLFLASADRKHVLHSVSGRAYDFVVNIDSTGDKGGDADTVSTAVSFNDITAIKALSTGQVLVSTLYGTWILELDYENAIFGEPYLRPIFQFPAGPVNELSIIDVLQDTAFITQSGIHAFNAVAQAKKESNNFPFGAPIKKLITDPETDKAIIQENTCAMLYDDYAFFAVNTIYGYGALVFDTTTGTFQSLDLSFGRVKQFAATKIAGSERMFFIDRSNQLFEAFASSEKNATRIYLGEWTPDDSGALLLVESIGAVFSDVKETGNVKISLYADKEFRESVVLPMTRAGEVPSALPLPIPFVNRKQSFPVGWQLANMVKCWRTGVLIEWDFDGVLTDISGGGQIEVSENTTMEVTDSIAAEEFACLGDSGFETTNLNPGGLVDFASIAVTQGAVYGFYGISCELMNGSQRITQGLFTAATDHVAVNGSGALNFYLRKTDNSFKVMQAIRANRNIKNIIHTGDFAYDSGSEIDTRLALLQWNIPIFVTAGNHDVVTDNGKYFFNLLEQPRYFSKAFNYVDFFFYNGEPFEPDGTISTSLQAGALKNWAAHSTKPFKFVVVHRPPYSDGNVHGDRASLQFLNASLGISGVLSGHDHNLQRLIINGFPYFVSGAGGKSLYGFSQDRASFQASVYGFLHITADPLNCKMDFKDINNNILDSYVIYS